MASLAVNYVEEQTSGSQTAVACAYCDYKAPETQQDVSILSNITRQLVEHLNPLPEVVKSFRDKHTEKTRNPTVDERVALLEAVAKSFQRVYVFVDALDECPEQQRSRLLLIIRKLLVFARLFITSRPHLHFDTELPNLRRLDLEAREEDVRAYVQSEIQMNDRLRYLTFSNQELKDEIVSRVAEKATGMFLLAHLQITHLNGLTSVAQIRKAIRSSPQELAKFYEDAIQRIEGQSESAAQLAKSALAFVHRAKRLLDVDELRHVLGIELGQRTMDPDSLPTAQILLNVSGGLIRISQRTRKVELVHHTLHEYFEANPHKVLQDSEAQFAAICLTYLSMDDFSSGPCADEASLQERLQTFSFLDYASRHWGQHVAQGQSQSLLAAVQSLLDDRAKVTSLVQVFNVPRRKTQGWHNQYPNDFSSLHLAACWGLDSFLTTLVHPPIEVDGQDSFGATPLLLAAQHGHASCVHVLTINGARKEILNQKGEGALYWAVRNGHLPIVQSLLDEGADLSAPDYDGWSPLDWAVINGNLEALLIILQEHSNGISPDLKSRALILAAEAGNDQAIEMLLKHGAEIDWQDDQGSTPLTWAVAEGHGSTILALLRNKADVNSTDNYLNTPLHWAVPHSAVAMELLKSGANVNAKNDSGQSPLLWCAQDGQLPVFQILVQESNVSLDIQDSLGFTALHAASLKGHVSMVKLLLDRGANPNLKDKDGWTPLHAACLRQHKDVVALLVDLAVDPASALEWQAIQEEGKLAFLEHRAMKKSEGSQAVTGLRWAASEGRLEKIRNILDSGAPIDAEDIGGWTALTIAAWMGQEAAVGLLLECGADISKRERGGRSALHIASQDGYDDVAQVLLNHGADLNAKAQGFSPLLLAAKNGHFSIVDTLVDRGVSVSVGDYNGQDALQWSVRRGCLTAAQHLIQQGAKVNAADRWGWTALMWAAWKGSRDFVSALLDANAEVEDKALDGSTALHLATYGGHVETVRFLLKRGAAINAKAEGGYTALHIATLMGYESIVRLLLQTGVDAGLEIRSSPLPQQAVAWPWNQEKDEDENDTVGGVVNRLLTVALNDMLVDQVPLNSRQPDISQGLTAYGIAVSNENLSLQGLLKGS